MIDKAIVINNMSKMFKGRHGNDVVAVKDVSLHISAGEVFGFLGPNGAGKSTTIKCLMGLLRLNAGSATILGEPAGTVKSNMQVGYLPENPSFFDYLSAEEYLWFVGRVFRVEETLLNRRIEEVLSLFDLQAARKRPMRSYSKGMVQRVGLAQTMVHNPQIYIFDEPMSGLDPVGRALVKDIIVDLKRLGKTVFFSTHITDDIEKVCDKVGIMIGGELKLVDHVDSIMMKGVIGYNVRLKGKDGEIQNHSVSKDQLTSFLSRCTDSGLDVVFLEPFRKNLQDLFLELTCN